MEKRPAYEIARYSLATAAALGAAATLSACGHQAKHARPPVRHNNAPIYQDGDTVPVTPGLTARVRGPQVIFYRQDLLKFIGAPPYDEVDIKMYNQFGVQEVTLVPGAIGGTNVETDEAQDEIMNCNPLGGPACKLEVWRGQPKYDSGTLEKLETKPKVIWIRPGGQTI